MIGSKRVDRDEKKVARRHAVAGCGEPAARQARQEQATRRDDGRPCDLHRSATDRGEQCSRPPVSREPRPWPRSTRRYSSAARCRSPVSCRAMPRLSLASDEIGRRRQHRSNHSIASAGWCASTSRTPKAVGGINRARVNRQCAAGTPARRRHGPRARAGHCRDWRRKTRCSDRWRPRARTPSRRRRRVRRRWRRA